MLVHNVADEVACHDVQVDAIGTYLIDFPGFLHASRADDPESPARVEAQVPMGHLGQLDELARSSAASVDGTQPLRHRPVRRLRRRLGLTSTQAPTWSSG
jgi:hypothetical protein